ncbi:MAG: SUMF1/EgtB/PvdO family nonheme iron enzyme, partial [Acidobacteria bacterium]|nr:SUMF1/EgtB/PvdO family nonheme iron enzyme [Acidobacteriota bacterium]
DVHGNVWEWCWDWYAAYPAGPVTDYRGGSDSSRVIRGGAWDSYARDCRSANRFRSYPDYRYDYGGFRLCRSAD